MHPTPDTSTDRFEALVAEARRALDRGDMAHASAVTARVAAADPAHPTTLELRAELAHRRADLPELADVLASLRRLRPADLSLAMDLAMVLVRVGDLPRAAAELEAILASEPHQLPASLLLGEVRMRQRRTTEACGHFMRALELAAATTLPPPGQDPTLHSMLLRAREVLRSERSRVVDATLLPLEQRYGGAALERIRECADVFLGRRPVRHGHPLQRPAMMYIPGLEPRPFFERSEFPWVAELEAGTAVIRDEYLALVRANAPGFEPYVRYPEGHREAAHWAEVNNSANWSAFHLFRHGQRIAANADRCPRTTALLDSLPLMRIRDHAPEVVFSVLQPHSRIPPHYGSVNGRLIVHLPLIVPPDCGALQAAGEARGWREGECLVFDDSFEHLAWNASDQVRVVMLLDIWNPQLSAAEREAFSALLVGIDDFHDAAAASRSERFD